MPGDISQFVFAIARVEPTGVKLLGTGFAISLDKIATAYHAVGADDRNLVAVFPRVSSLLDYQDTADLTVKYMPLTVSAVDPIHDLCVLQGNFRSGHGYGLSSADVAPPGTPVVTFGFPHANTSRMVLTQQFAHVGARVLIEADGIKSKHIVLNTQSRDGQSGGPVFDSSLSTVVAVLLGSYAPQGGGGILVAGVDPATLHQTTHAISAEYLRGML